MYVLTRTQVFQERGSVYVARVAKAVVYVVKHNLTALNKKIHGTSVNT
jgi:hypothetical protein